VERLRRMRRRLRDPQALEATVSRLVEEGHLSEARAASLRESLPHTVEASGYVLKHLAVHVFLCIVFAMDMLPLPLGMISRSCWVAGHRVYHTFRGDERRKQVHSYPVLAASLIPWLGGLAYVIPLRKVGDHAVFLYANHICYEQWDRSLEAFLVERPDWFSRRARRLMGLPDGEAFTVPETPSAGA